MRSKEHPPPRVARRTWLTDIRKAGVNYVSHKGILVVVKLAEKCAIGGKQRVVRMV